MKKEDSKEISKNIKNDSYVNYLIKDKDIIRTQCSSAINFKDAMPIDDIAKLDCSSTGILEDIKLTIEKLDITQYDALGFRFCGGLVLRSNKCRVENIDDLFLYKLTVFPLVKTDVGYHRISGAGSNIYYRASGTVEKVIHFSDLKEVLENLGIVKDLNLEDDFKKMTACFYEKGKAIIVIYHREKGRVLKKN